MTLPPKKICLFPRYHIEGPSSRERIFRFSKALKEAGYSIEIQPLLYDGYVKGLYTQKKVCFFRTLNSYLKRIWFLVSNAKQFDLLIAEKEFFPMLPAFFERFLIGKVPYVLDYDDAIFLRYRDDARVRWLLGRKIEVINHHAQCTIAGNHWYETQFEARRFFYFPTSIDLERFPAAQLFSGHNDVPVIVWLGSPSTFRYLKELKDVLIQTFERAPFKLRVIGDQWIEKVPFEVENIQWDELTEIQYLFASDIGIMPSQNNEWANGKCGWKLLQYMAAGLATVASPSAANIEILENDQQGRIAATESEWVAHLSELLKSKEVRTVMGKNGRARIEAAYTLEFNLNRLKTEINHILEQL